MVTKHTANNKFSSIYSTSAQYALNFSFFHGRFPNCDPLQEFFNKIFIISAETDYSLSHEKLFQQLTLFFTYFKTKNDLHQPPKLTHFSTPFFPNLSLPPHVTFIFK